MTNRIFKPAVCALLVCALAGIASAQDATSGDDQSIQPPAPPSPIGRLTFHPIDRDLSGRWAPLGAIPVDQAGGGRRGYVVAGEDSDVAAAGSNRLSVHAVSANNFYREQAGDFLVTSGTKPTVSRSTTGADSSCMASRASRSVVRCSSTRATAG